jgi:hypothetical protein
MTDVDVSQIRVGKFTTGIIGLKSVLQDMADGLAKKSSKVIARRKAPRQSP